MDDSRLHDADNCFKLPKHSESHNYTLRSASKMNPSRKYGVYYKFKKGANVTNCSKQNDTVMSRIEQVQTQNSRQKNLFNENELPSTSRIDKEETAKTNDRSRLAAVNNSVMYPKNSTINNYTLRSASKENPFRKPGVPSKFLTRADVINESEPRTPPRLDQKEISRILSDEERRDRPQIINETSFKPAKPQNSSNTSFSSKHNSSFRSTMYPRVLLKRCDVDDRLRREAIAQSVVDTEGSVAGLSIKRQQELKIFDAGKQNAKRLMSLVTDCLSSAEAFYLLNKISSTIQETIQRYKKVEAELHPTPSVAQDNMMHVVDWLKSNDGSEIAASIITNNQRNVHPVKNYNSSENNNRTIYILKDWTLLKGEGIFDVMVSGNLLNINSGNLIEEKHTSSTVTSATPMIVQTNCCMYQLQGEFRNPGKCIPFSVSKYFQDGKFPPEWREVIKMWSVLILSENNRARSTNAHRPAENYTDNYSADEMSDCNSEDEIRHVSYRIPCSNRGGGVNERYQSNKKDGRRIQGELHDRWVREPVNNRVKRNLCESINTAHDSRLISNREIEDRRIRARHNEIRRREDARIREQNERFQDNGERHQSNIFGQKRHFKNMVEDDDDDEIHDERANKRQRVEKSLPKRKKLATPAAKRVPNVMTRSAVRRNAEIIQTPKSSKTNKLPRRGHTPMPPRMARRLYEQDESSIVDNSDLM